MVVGKLLTLTTEDEWGEVGAGWGTGPPRLQALQGKGPNGSFF